ncbi:3-hydroxyacyl-CoA dehydrogenase family protein [Mycetocola sp. CAN_C7]|uniref:3-hydroxyacyl-CoA dehydrogenase family protein n=1 Tax=Mycetocola sp. CAN_C7 TaxID=2787724 RepID=UPI003FA5F3C7
MGAGIAHAFLVAGSAVVVVERDGEQAAAATNRIRASVTRSVERGSTTVTEADLMSGLTVGTEMAAFRGCGLVVEAVPENPDLKMEALRSVEAVLDVDAALASTTSAISIDELAAHLARPEFFLGLHFFNPVPASTLVEVVLGGSTTPELAALALGWVGALGKTPITVTDAPGFASSRLGVTVALEAIRMLEDGVASAADIDAAMVLGYRFPVGPLRLTDQVGLDVRLGIAEYLHTRLGERFAPPQLLRDKVARGELGRKTGRGFFDWDPSRVADLTGSAQPPTPSNPATRDGNQP